MTAAILPIVLVVGFLAGVSIVGGDDFTPLLLKAAPLLRTLLLNSLAVALVFVIFKLLRWRRSGQYRQP